MSMLGLMTLLRPPNVFTAFADSFAGLVMLAGLGVTVPHRAWVIVLASGCLYLAGIVFNDIFDRKVGARERPTRPIPSGVVPLRVAVLIAVVLMSGSLAIACWVGRGPGLLAVALAGCILVYDVGVKSTVRPDGDGRLPRAQHGAGPVDRAGLALGARWPAVAVAGPLFLTLYVAGLTHLARDEVGGNTAWRARAGVAFLGILAVGAVIGIAAAPGLPGSLWAWAWVALALILGVRKWAPVWRRHDPASTGRAIGGGIVLIPVLDAAVCAVTRSPERSRSWRR